MISSKPVPKKRAYNVANSVTKWHGRDNIYKRSRKGKLIARKFGSGRS